MAVRRCIHELHGEHRSADLDLIARSEQACPFDPFPVHERAVPRVLVADREPVRSARDSRVPPRDAVIGRKHVVEDPQPSEHELVLDHELAAAAIAGRGGQAKGTGRRLDPLGCDIVGARSITLGHGSRLRRRRGLPGRCGRRFREHRPRSSHELAAARISLRSRDGHRRRDHLVDSGRKVGAGLRRAGPRISDVRVEHVDVPLADERRRTHERFVENASERIHVDPVVAVLRQDLLGRRVRQGPDHLSGPRKRDRVLLPVLAQPEIRQVRVRPARVARDDDVARIDVAVHQPARVRRVERVGYLPEDRHGQCEAQWTVAPEQLAEDRDRRRIASRRTGSRRGCRRSRRPPARAGG